MIRYFSIILFLFSLNCFSLTIPKQSLQLVLVTTVNWHASTGTLTRFERTSFHAQWQQVGNAFPVVIGKNGLALITDKKEGDLRTPAGLFTISQAFGFAPKTKLKLPYLPIRANTICIDDPFSKHYNEIINNDTIKPPDWRSYEAMRHIPLYEFGAIVDYNTVTKKPGAGSCIFLHQWRNAYTGTAGCIAMERQNLISLLTWLDARAKPVILLN